MAWLSGVNGEWLPLASRNRFTFGPCAQLLPQSGAETGQQCTNTKGKGR